MKELREAYLKDTIISIDGKEYKSATSTCKQGYIQMSTSHTNIGVYVSADIMLFVSFYSLPQFSVTYDNVLYYQHYQKVVLMQELLPLYLESKRIIGFE